MKVTTTGTEATLDPIADANAVALCSSRFRTVDVAWPTERLLKG
jgi:hypothetical protein